MIITRKHARSLARIGRATIEDTCTTDDRGRRWQVVTRHDVQRVDHYLVRPSTDTQVHGPVIVR